MTVVIGQRRRSMSGGPGQSREDCNRADEGTAVSPEQSRPPHARTRQLAASEKLLKESLGNQRRTRFRLARCGQHLVNLGDLMAERDDLMQS